MFAHLLAKCFLFNTLRPRQNCRNFADDIFKGIFLNENVWISLKISLKCVPKGPINNIPTLVLIMVWHRPSDKPLSEPMIDSSLTHICVTRPQWFHSLWPSSEIWQQAITWPNDDPDQCRHMASLGHWEWKSSSAQIDYKLGFVWWLDIEQVMNYVSWRSRAQYCVQCIICWLIFRVSDWTRTRRMELKFEFKLFIVTTAFELSLKFSEGCLILFRYYSK